MANPKVFVGIPTLGSSDDACYISVSMALTHYKGPSMLCPHGGKPIGHNRNMIVTKFLETDAEYLWFVDNDCIIPINALELLLEADKPIVSGLYPVLKLGMVFYFCAGNLNDDPDTQHEGRFRMLERQPEGLTKVHMTGMGCCLIKRELFEKTKFPWFQDFYFSANPKHHSHEDYYFYQQLHALDIYPYVDPRVVCGHIKKMDVTRLWRAAMRVREEATEESAKDEKIVDVSEHDDLDSGKTLHSIGSGPVATPEE